MTQLRLKKAIALQFERVDRNGQATDLPPIAIQLPDDWQQFCGPQLTQAVEQLHNQILKQLKPTLWQRIRGTKK